MDKCEVCGKETENFALVTGYTGDPMLPLCSGECETKMEERLESNWTLRLHLRRERWRQVPEVIAHIEAILESAGKPRLNREDRKNIFYHSKDLQSWVSYLSEGSNDKVKEAKGLK